MSKSQSRFLTGLCLLIWMGGIYYFSDQANSNKISEEMFGGLNYFVRKGAHVTEYGVLFFLAFWFRMSFIDKSDEVSQELGASGEPAEEPKFQRFLNKCLLPMIFSILYACSDEWHQSFVPGRSALFSDVLIDSIGIFIATGLAWIFAV